MFQFGNQVEFRVDRRHLLFLLMGGILWTVLAFFLGMWSMRQEKQPTIMHQLHKLGWLDREAAWGGAQEERVADAHLAASEIRGVKPQKTSLLGHSATSHPKGEAKKPTKSIRKASSQQSHRKKAQGKAILIGSGVKPKAEGRPSPHTSPKQEKKPTLTKKASSLVASENAIAPSPAALEGKAVPSAKAAMVSWKEARYTIQIRFSSDKNTLSRLHKRLYRRGYPVQLSSEAHQRMRYFRLTLGYFRDRSTAKRYLDSFVKKEKQRATLLAIKK
jgi:hypothetical protein